MRTDDSFAYDDGDVDTNRSEGLHLSQIVEARYSRRQTLRSGLSAATAAFLGGTFLTACGSGSSNIADEAITVTAGQSATTTAGKAVGLSGIVTSGVSTASSWRQVSGPTVTLANANTAQASFVAPAVAAATPLVFEFSGKDAGGQTATAMTTITVNPAALGFSATAKNLNDIVTVPAGYSVTVLYRLGDPIVAGAAAYGNVGNDTEFSKRAGDHHDGMYFFGLADNGNARDVNSNTRGMLAVNHENISQRYLHPNGATSTGGVRPEAEVVKEMEAHGVSIVEVKRAADTGIWGYVQAGALNRRITPLTPTSFKGPVAGSPVLQTVYSPAGTAGRGTLNNCAMGFTPWGTYITCEENWAGYFRRRTATDNPLRSAREVTALTRYGVTSATGNYGWATVTPADPNNSIYARHTAEVSGASATADFRNEANQFGWVVEIDPYDPATPPRKRTALGRMNHEGCWPGRFVAGVRPAWYMGDDARNEYIYKFVSDTGWVEADANQADRLATGDKYLDAGTLYVAQFAADGTGTWMPLTFGSGPLTPGNAAYAFADQADVLAHARLAGDALGATKMDRPEWTAVNPVTGEMYCTLTNNSTRTLTNTDAANPRFYNDPKGAAPGTPQLGNPNGHIIRLRETGDTTEATGFQWDIYAFGAGKDLPAAVNVSGLDDSNDFSSPDGLWFGRPQNASGQVKPLLWIETDDSAYTDVTNCMLLAAQPGNVGDGPTGGARTITNTDPGGATNTQGTFVGAAPGANLKRFLVGPKDCEITGIDTTPDGRSLFINIQHPGEIDPTPSGFPTTFPSNWPSSQSGSTTASRPRSATIVITKDDGGVVGL